MAKDHSIRCSKSGFVRAFVPSLIMYDADACSSQLSIVMKQEDVSLEVRYLASPTMAKNISFALKRLGHNHPLTTQEEVMANSK